MNDFKKALIISVGVYAIIFMLGFLIGGSDGAGIIAILGVLEALVLLILGIVYVAIGKQRIYWGVGFLTGAVLIMILGYAGCAIVFQWSH